MFDLARHQGDEPLDPEREAAVRRRAHPQGLEEPAELACASSSDIPMARKTRSCTSRRWILIDPEPSSQPFQIRS